MAKVITILAALLVSANSFAQAPNCLWAKAAGGTSDDRGYSTCTDANGNVYVTGSFKGQSITFGSIVLTNSDNSGVTSDIFIVKYSSIGSVLWASSTGGLSFDEGLCITTDASGNVYLTGRFDSPTITFGTTTLSKVGNHDIFIAKYSSQGTLLWANSAGGINYDNVTGISTDANSNVFITGFFYSATIAFGTTSLSNASSSGTFTDMYIAKYDSTGVLLWANLAGGTSFDFGNSICNDSNGNAYVTGSFVGSITFGSTTLTSAGDVFITKYSPNGLVIWAKKLGSTSGATVNGICTNSNDDIYITGEFQSSSLTIGATTLTNSNNSGNSRDIYVVKCIPAGTFQWAKSAGGIGNDYAYCVSADENGNAYITGGYTSPTISFGTSTLTNADNSGNTSDIYFTSYGSDGTVLQAKSIGEGSDDFGKSLTLDASGYVYLTGYFKSASMDLGTFTLTNAGDNDLFIAKYTGPTTGVIESFDNTLLNISPNPTFSTFTLTIPKPINTNITITNLTGKQIATYSLQNTTTKTIDVSHLAEGVYFVTLKSDEGLVSKKIIKTN
jgi:hypothetical protein